MSQVSPYARSTAERSQHWQATAIFVVVVAAIFCAANWLANLERFPWKPEPPPPDNVTTLTGDRETSRTSDERVVDWAASIAAVEQTLPQSDTPEVQDVKWRLASIANDLQSSQLSADAEATIQHSLNTLQQQAESLSALSDRPRVNAQGIAEGIATDAQSILMAEQAAIQQARDQAERAVRQKQQPTIRNVRLELRDQQDQATELRSQITQVQREQAEFQAKDARAKALQAVMADVQEYLQPFTSPGYLQPEVGKSPWDPIRTIDPMPVSLARLQQSGALDRTEAGLLRLYIFGGGKNPGLNNSRPLGSFPQYWAQHLSKPDVLEAVKRAQQLLRDHGQAMVEAQLLSK